MLTVAGVIGCSSASAPTIASSDDDYTSVASGLWALDGDAEHGDIELLQLARQSYASIVREVQPAAAASDGGAGDGGAGGLGRAESASAGLGRTGSATGAPRGQSRSAMGNLMRTGRATGPTVSLTMADEQHFTVAEAGDTLTLTRADGRVLTYRRSYELYCVPTDRSLEATVILELGKEPKIVGVNGDGHIFPSEGTHDATVRTDILFRLHDYEIVSNLGHSSVTVKLPWSEMSKSELEGTLAISGPASAVAPTPITCERILPIQY